MSDFPKTIPWAFGSPAERAAGGVMGRLWMDSIFPYTTPEELPEWWPEAFPPDGPGAVGAFPGFQRNMRENGGDGAPNFEQSPPLPITVGRPFNIVLLNTNGLIQSDEAPYRLHTLAASEDVWPQNVPGGAILLLRLYVENYLHPDTRVILVIPEREIIHLGIKPETILPAGSPSANPVLGSIGIREFVKEALKLLGDRLVGWFMIDEPDLLLFKKELFATPETMSHLRDLIRQAEDEYAEEEEVENWHRPCIINFSPNWHSHPTAPQPQDFAYLSNGRVGLDMAWLDRYPWRITKDDVPNILVAEGATNFSAVIAAMNITGEGEFQSDPVKTAKIFRELVLRVNTGAGLGSANYVPVMWFLQTHGNPYRMGDAHPSFLPSSAVEPTPPPEWIEFGTIKHARTLRRPTIDEARFEAWLSIFGGSEGLAYYMQSKVADDLMWDIHRWVAHEISYFEGLRIQAPHHLPFENLTKDVILKQYYHYSDAVKRGEMGAYMRPLVRIYRYSNPPSGASEEFWMFILNRANAQLPLSLKMPHGVWRWGLQEYRYGDPFDAPVDLEKFVPKDLHNRRIKGAPMTAPLWPLGAHRFRLYKGVYLHPK